MQIRIVCYAKKSEIMSVRVRIRTKKNVKPDELLKRLENQGEKIVALSNEFPSVVFGTHLKADTVLLPLPPHLSGQRI